MASEKRVAVALLLSVSLGVLFVPAGVVAAESPDADAGTNLSPEAVRDIMKKVADWQLAHPSKHATTDWTHGALFAGLTAWARMSDESRYVEALKEFGDKNNWQLGKRVYHADDHAVGQMYLELYTIFKHPEMLRAVRERFDYILSHSSNVTLETGKQQLKDRWWWCDALFMSPPVWAKLAMLTGRHEYLDFMNKEFRATTDYLYDPQEHLYYRDDRYFDKREANGQKVFWSRGNGWVIAGIVRVLEAMPADYPDRPMYVKIYKQMAEKLAEIQPDDGLWRASLLDAEDYPAPETSGTGFFCYAIAWGINRDILDAETYLPVVEKAWQGLTGAVDSEGKLGWVQPIGADPRKVTADMTEIYGVGAFLLAGSEVYKIALLGDADGARISATNPITLFRDSHTLEIPLDKLNAAAPKLQAENLAVLDCKTGKLLVTQLLGTDDKDGSETLLYQTDFAPNERKVFWVVQRTARMQITRPGTRAFCRFVPERKDDFAWENDRIAFRMYGPALEGSGEATGSGVDVWAKKVRYPVIDKWYEQGDYHADHGEGLDFYKVGSSRGCGGCGIWKDGRLYVSRVFSDWRILANGPIRVVFELSYKPFDVAGRKVSELKRISLDLGSNLNRFESRFVQAEDDDRLEAAAGIVKRDSAGRVSYDLDRGWLSYWPPAVEGGGVLGCGVVAGSQGLRFRNTDEHLLLIKEIQASDKSFVYFAGAGWDKSGDFKTAEDWQGYLEDFSAKLKNPLKISVEAKKGIY